MSWLILLTYLIQVVVIIRFPVPSEVSTLQLLTQDHGGIPGHRRGLLVGLGVLGILTFHLPLIFVLVPAVTPNQLLIFIYPHSAIQLAVVGMCLITGTVLSILGVIALRGHRHQNSGVVPEQFQMEGIYRVCRHPVNLGLMLIMLGFFLAYPFWIMVPGVAAFFYNLHTRARLEERFLTSLYGDSYRVYQQRVPMYGLPIRPK